MRLRDVRVGLLERPSGRQNPRHLGVKATVVGGVSALCYRTQRPINLRTASWTVREAAVTCERCRKILRERQA